ncbi:MAG: sugar ABC transporter permease [Phycisphaerae bacterium]|nr:sugar ABC transporter permease [Phycisphaerae bacterium]
MTHDARHRKADRAALLSGLAWTAPWWLGFLLLMAGPLVATLYLSFCDYSLLEPPAFVGVENYVTLVRDENVHKVLWNTLIYAAISVPLMTALAVGLAILVNQPIRGQAFFRAAIFVPTIVPLVAAGIVWMWLLNPESGLVNETLKAIGISRPPLWLESPQWAMTTLIGVSLWFVGTPMVIYLAGLQEIPETLYEAARLDGASAWGRFWHVTLPGLSPVILFNVVVGLINAWQVFALPFVMWRTRPGPDRAAYFYTTYLFDNAFTYLKMGYASALAWVQLLIILTLTGLVFWLSRRSVHYVGR